jgi:hypothetical protein
VLPNDLWPSCTMLHGTWLLTQPGMTVEYLAQGGIVHKGGATDLKVGGTKSASGASINLF